jgi:spore coat protein CotH
MREAIKLVPRFDKNGDKRLDDAERKAAREFIQQERAAGRGRRGPGGSRGPGREENLGPPQPGPKVSPAQVNPSPTNAPLYDPMTLRTFFLEFENADWEKELADFNNTDVELPAKLTVGGKTYAGVGVHFRGASSFSMVGEGRKRSLNLSLDFVHKGQRLYGYRTLNLLNAHEDPSFLRTVLYLELARQYIPAPKANFARVVINGESWGVYVNAQQFNKDFVKEAFGADQGARWKAPGSPRGDSGLSWHGDDVAEYKRRYEIKSKDDPKSWASLIELCRVLDQTPPDKLEAALEPLLDVDGALKFLALENVFINNDGYWVRASDYDLYLDPKGRFHLVPYDANETFSLPGGPGSRGPRRFGPGPGGPGGPGASGGPNPPPGNETRPRVNGVELNPLQATNDSSKPLLSKLLAVPALRARYLAYVREIAATWLDWNKLGPLAQRYHSLIASEVQADTRKLVSTEDFNRSLTEDLPGRGPGGRISLKNFADQRRAFLLKQAIGTKAE